MSEDVLNRARDLEKRYRSLVAELDGNPLVWDLANGLRWGKDRTLQERLEVDLAAVKAWQELEGHVRAHRAELGSDPHWRRYLDDQPAEPTPRAATSDPAAVRRSERGRQAANSKASSPTPPRTGGRRPGRQP